jgi:hypothetical protein
MRLVGMVGALMLCARLLAQAPPAPTGRLDTAPPPSEKFPAEWYSAQDPYHPLPEGGATNSDAPVVGAPFSGTSVMSTEISVPGSAPRFSRMREFTMRDSAGRTRTEEEFEVDGMPAALASQMKKQIEVNDVVTHCSFRWVEPARSEAEKTATVQCLPRTVTLRPDGMESKMSRQMAETDHPYPGVTSQIEPLGEKVIAGVRALGIRVTTTDAHSDAGQPQITEMWWSPEIKEVVEIKPIGDPAGRPTTEMTDIKRQEPDPALFYPPDGYKIVTEIPAN